MPKALAHSICVVGVLLAGAAAAAPSTVSPLTVQGASPRTITAEAHTFVESHATAPNPEVGQIGRWHDPVCVQVEGLAQAIQADQIKARIESVAQAVGVPAAPKGCEANVEIVFTDNPQSVMDDLGKRRADLLGYYHRRDYIQLKTVNHPIQAWYKTATAGDSAYAGAENPAFDQGSGAGSSHRPAGKVMTDDPDTGTPNACGDSPHFTACLTSEFLNVFIVVDSKALPGKSLGPIADYLTMLALSQPKLDRCTALSSILDLTAKTACPGRAAPDGDPDRRRLAHCALRLRPRGQGRWRTLGNRQPHGRHADQDQRVRRKALAPGARQKKGRPFQAAPDRPGCEAAYAAFSPSICCLPVAISMRRGLSASGSWRSSEIESRPSASSAPVTTT